jgi:D-amino-acid dehydrogenase
MGRFAAAAFQRAKHTTALAPLVLPAARDWQRWLEAIERPQLLRRHGHYEIGYGAKSRAAFAAQATIMRQLGVKAEPVSEHRLHALKRAAGVELISGLWFEDSAHVIDPLHAVQAFADAAVAYGAQVRRLEVRALRPCGDKIEIHNEGGPLRVDAAVVCAGMGSQALLAPFGVHAPLQSVRGYHIELSGQAPFMDAPVVHTNDHLLVTPMAKRLRASSFMEFAAADALPDPRKVKSLRQKVRAWGYTCEPDGPTWVGARPILPDYLPGIGRATGSTRLFYAVGHQHIGLTLAPVTGDLVADLVGGRTPRLPVRAFDLRRFGAPPR